MKQGTSQADRVLSFIEAEIAAGRGFPTHAAIGAHMQWKNAGSATSVMVMLVGAGFLTKTWRRGHWEFALRDGPGNEMRKSAQFVTGEDAA